MDIVFKCSLCSLGFLLVHKKTKMRNWNVLPFCGQNNFCCFPGNELTLNRSLREAKSHHPVWELPLCLLMQSLHQNSLTWRISLTVWDTIISWNQVHLWKNRTAKQSWSELNDTSSHSTVSQFLLILISSIWTMNQAWLKRIWLKSGIWVTNTLARQRPSHDWTNMDMTRTQQNLFSRQTYLSSLYKSFKKREEK